MTATTRRTSAGRSVGRRGIEVYRIGFAPAPTLDGQAFGSTLQEGRWHTPGSGAAARRVVHAAASRALAQLEKRVHANGEQPVNQALFVLELPAGLRIPHAHERKLPPDWQTEMTASQQFGNSWLDAGRELAMWVPSVIEPAEYNILINANHPRFGSIELRVERDPFEFDPRML